MSYYQRYRPEKIEDLDLSQARNAFLKIMAEGKTAHAYLLVGPRGSGKTSSARILARMVNCEKNNKGNKKKLVEPCGECAACVAIKNGSAPDVLEIDAASHRSIDDIRDLREKVRLAPVALAKKVYIIDEVHMLTTEAFNALLKTLEEPPEQVMFILCTTEAHKVPETIASRCVKINFTKAGKEELVSALKRAAVGEGLQVEDGALELLAEATDGSFREGHKMLEQLSESGKITNEAVKSGLKLTGAGEVGNLLLAVKERQPAEVIEYLKSFEETGVEVLWLTTRLLAALREKMTKEIAAGRKIDRWELKLIDRLIRVVPKFKISPLPYLPLEVVLVRTASLGQVPGSEAPEKEPSKIKREVGVTEKKSAPKKEAVEVEAVENVKPLGEISFEKIEDGWQELLTRISPRNQSIAGLLRSAKPKQIDNKFLTIEVFYKFHKDQLEQESKRSLIEDEIAKLWGPLSVKCTLGDRALPRESPIKVDRISATNVVGTDDDMSKAAEEIFGS